MKQEICLYISVAFPISFKSKTIKISPNVFSVAASIDLPLKNRDEDEVSNPSTLGAVGQL